MDCVDSVVAEDLTGEQAYDLLFGRAISSLFAAADRGIGFNDQIFFFRTSLFLELDLHLVGPQLP